MLTRRDALAMVVVLPTGAVLGLATDLGMDRAATSEMPARGAFVADRALTLTLSDNLQRQVWEYAGQLYAEARDEIDVNEDERIRVTLINDTPASHSLTLDDTHFALAPSESMTVELSIDSLEARTFRIQHTGVVRAIRVRPSYQSHAIFAA